jgi:hypothetical protein
MALDDRRHVEAYAIIKRLVGDEPGFDPTEPDAYAVLRDAGLQWLKENRPAPGVYTAVARELGGELREDDDDGS